MKIFVLYKIIVCFMFILLSAVDAPALSIEEAYKAIPHRQTLFDAKNSTLAEADKVYLQEFLHIVDLAMVERVGMLLWLNTNGRQGLVADDYDSIIRKLKSFTPSDKFQNFQNLVVEAVELQRDFLEEGNISGLSGNAKVRAASGKLHQAYGILMGLYPNETPENKQAFFDYLCALDFI